MVCKNRWCLVSKLIPECLCKPFLWFDLGTVLLGHLRLIASLTWMGSLLVGMVEHGKLPCRISWKDKACWRFDGTSDTLFSFLLSFLGPRIQILTIYKNSLIGSRTNSFRSWYNTYLICWYSLRQTLSSSPLALHQIPWLQFLHCRIYAEYA